MKDILTAILMLLGAAFTVLAALGIARMPDTYMRLQTASKGVALGTGFSLLAVAVHFQRLGVFTNAVLVIAFVLLTTPIAAHLIGRAASYVGVPLWEGSVVDELRDRYDPVTHALTSGMDPRRRTGEDREVRGEENF